MAPTIGADVDPTQVDGSAHSATAPAVIPMPALAGVPHRDELVEQLEQTLFEIRARRGRVLMPDDAHDLVRALVQVRERVQAAAATMSAFLAVVDGELGEELISAVGADDAGVPAANLAVPYEGMKIHVRRKFVSDYTTDRDQLFAATAKLVALGWARDEETPADDPERFAAEVAAVVTEDVLGKANVKSTGVDGLATSLGEIHGRPDLASVARSAHVKGRSRFVGIEVEVTTPTSSKRPPVGRRPRRPA